jgi:uncharacterized protein (TIGR00725 family)
MPRTIIAVVGGFRILPEVEKQAYELGRRIGEAGWVLLTGGRDGGVMAAAASGARDAGGITVGILPGKDRSGIAQGVDIAILTGMGDARNVINVLSADVVVALSGGAGTLSEISLAANNNRPIILLGPSPEIENATKALQPDSTSVKGIDDVITTIESIIG